jgi:N-acyl-D-aspartate/D-glutamate deacylase
MERLSRETGRPVTFACLQNDADPAQWKRLLAAADGVAARGGRLAPQIAARPTSMLMGLQSSIHPFALHQGYHAVAHLPLDERVRRLREPAVRDAILGEKVTMPNALLAYIVQSFHKLFPLGDPPDYEPGPEQSVAGIAAREGRTPEAVAYDLLLANDGRGFLYFPFLNYSDGDFGAIHTMLGHPLAVVGLSDGGAHCGVICDASTPTYQLTHLVRDRHRGPRLIEHVVAHQTRQICASGGMATAASGARDARRPNVIDPTGCNRRRAGVILPANGRRSARARYRTTVKRGAVTFVDGEPTGSSRGAWRGTAGSVSAAAVGAGASVICTATDGDAVARLLDVVSPWRRQPTRASHVRADATGTASATVVARFRHPANQRAEEHGSSPRAPGTCFRKLFST